MEVFWLEQSEADAPEADDWLSEIEAARLSSFRFAKRRADWRLGRWTAKCAVASSLKLPNDHRSLKLIEIVQASTGQPEVVLRNRAEAVTISISHRDGLAICAVTRGSVALGCDLEVAEERSGAFTADYFTADEQSLIASTCAEKRPALLALLWSAKESALKALHVGLRADTRSVRVEIAGWIHWFGGAGTLVSEVGRPPESLDVSVHRWRPLQVHSADGTDFQGWWQSTGNILRTVVADPPLAPPVELRPLLLATASATQAVNVSR